MCVASGIGRLRDGFTGFALRDFYSLKSGDLWLSSILGFGSTVGSIKLIPEYMVACGPGCRGLRVV